MSKSLYCLKRRRSGHGIQCVHSISSEVVIKGKRHFTTIGGKGDTGRGATMLRLRSIRDTAGVPRLGNRRDEAFVSMPAKCAISMPKPEARTCSHRAGPAITMIARAHRHNPVLYHGFLASPATRRVELEVTRTTVGMAAMYDVFLRELVFS